MIIIKHKNRNRLSQDKSILDPRSSRKGRRRRHREYIFKYVPRSEGHDFVRLKGHNQVPAYQCTSSSNYRTIEAKGLRYFHRKNELPYTGAAIGCLLDFPIAVLDVRAIFLHEWEEN